MSDDVRNASIGRPRPRDLAITDFRFLMRPDSVLIDRTGRTFLLFAPIPPPRQPVPLGAVGVSERVRRYAEWAMYAFFGSGAAAACWFVFIVPR